MSKGLAFLFILFLSALQVSTAYAKVSDYITKKIPVLYDSTATIQQKKEAIKRWKEQLKGVEREDILEAISCNKKKCEKELLFEIQLEQDLFINIVNIGLLGFVGGEKSFTNISEMISDQLSDNEVRSISVESAQRIFKRFSPEHKQLHATRSYYSLIEAYAYTSKQEKRASFRRKLRSFISEIEKDKEVYNNIDKTTYQFFNFNLNQKDVLKKGARFPHIVDLGDEDTVQFIEVSNLDFLVTPHSFQKQIEYFQSIKELKGEEVLKISLRLSKRIEGGHLSHVQKKYALFNISMLMSIAQLKKVTFPESFSLNWVRRARTISSYDPQFLAMWLHVAASLDSPAQSNLLGILKEGIWQEMEPYSLLGEVFVHFEYFQDIKRKLNLDVERTSYKSLLSQFEMEKFSLLKLKSPYLLSRNYLEESTRKFLSSIIPLIFEDPSSHVTEMEELSSLSKKQKDYLLETSIREGVNNRWFRAEPTPKRWFSRGDLFGAVEEIYMQSNKEVFPKLLNLIKKINPLEKTQLISFLSEKIALKLGGGQRVLKEKSLIALIGLLSKEEKRKVLYNLEQKLKENHSLLLTKQVLNFFQVYITGPLSNKASKGFGENCQMTVLKNGSKNELLKIDWASYQKLLLEKRHPVDQVDLSEWIESQSSISGLNRIVKNASCFLKNIFELFPTYYPHILNQLIDDEKTDGVEPLIILALSRFGINKTQKIISFLEDNEKVLGLLYLVNTSKIVLKREFSQTRKYNISKSLFEKIIQQRKRRAYYTEVARILCREDKETCSFFVQNFIARSLFNKGEIDSEIKESLSPIVTEVINKRFSDYEHQFLEKLGENQEYSGGDLDKIKFFIEKLDEGNELKLFLNGILSLSGQRNFDLNLSKILSHTNKKAFFITYLLEVLESETLNPEQVEKIYAFLEPYVSDRKELNEIILRTGLASTPLIENVLSQTETLDLNNTNQKALENILKGNDYLVEHKMKALKIYVDSLLSSFPNTGASNPVINKMIGFMLNLLSRCTTPDDSFCGGITRQLVRLSRFYVEKNKKVGLFSLGLKSAIQKGIEKRKDYFTLLIQVLGQQKNGAGTMILAEISLLDLYWWWGTGEDKHPLGKNKLSQINYLYKILAEKDISVLSKYYEKFIAGNCSLLYQLYSVFALKNIIAFKKEKSFKESAVKAIKKTKIPTYLNINVNKSKNGHDYLTAYSYNLLNGIGVQTSYSQFVKVSLAYLATPQFAPYRKMMVERVKDKNRYSYLIELLSDKDAHKKVVAMGGKVETLIDNLWGIIVDQGVYYNFRKDPKCVKAGLKAGQYFWDEFKAILKSFEVKNEDNFSMREKYRTLLDKLVYVQYKISNIKIEEKDEKVLLGFIDNLEKGRNFVESLSVPVISSSRELSLNLMQGLRVNHDPHFYKILLNNIRRSDDENIKQLSFIIFRKLYDKNPYITKLETQKEILKWSKKNEKIWAKKIEAAMLWEREKFPEIFSRDAKVEMLLSLELEAIVLPQKATESIIRIYLEDKVAEDMLRMPAASEKQKKASLFYLFEDEDKLRLVQALIVAKQFDFEMTFPKIAGKVMNFDKLGDLILKDLVYMFKATTDPERARKIGNLIKGVASELPKSKVLLGRIEGKFLYPESEDLKRVAIDLYVDLAKKFSEKVDRLKKVIYLDPGLNQGTAPNTLSHGNSYRLGMQKLKALIRESKEKELMDGIDITSKFIGFIFEKYQSLFSFHFPALKSVILELPPVKAKELISRLLQFFKNSAHNERANFLYETLSELKINKKEKLDILKSEKGRYEKHKKPALYKERVECINRMLKQVNS